MDTRPQGNRDNRVQLVYLNESIKAPNIIILDEAGENLGTFPRRRALEIAQEKGLDLVQLRYDHENMISTVRMVDYGKYQYQKSKDDREKKKTQKPKVLKEIKLNYAIGDNDLLLKMKKAKEFLAEKHNVKFSIKLKGREKIYATKAMEKLKKIKDDLVDFGKAQYDIPKQEAHGYSIILFSK
ncbi:MAG: translation initiation factor IF-3 [candidate division SR1 bacterium]|nr:translation initiation factor IF-3 [candidate division SR1 bacterium]